MDSLKLNMVAVDQIYPLLSDLVQAMMKVGAGRRLAQQVARVPDSRSRVGAPPRCREAGSVAFVLDCPGSCCSIFHKWEAAACHPG